MMFLCVIHNYFLNSEVKKMPIYFIYRNLFMELKRRNTDNNKIENKMEKDPICSSTMKNKKI